WDLMEKDAEAYRMRIRSAIREEMIHSIQVITVKSRYDRSIDLTRQFKTAESYYEHLLGKIIDELATSREGQEVVCTAAQLYYEDWSITSMQKLRETDKKLHGRDGYLVSELIRQLVQIIPKVPSIRSPYYIDTEFIEQNWGDVLRLIATINSLYRALKGFGKTGR